METFDEIRNMDTFDANDINSWYYGEASREQAESLLMLESQNGVFLVRSSSTRSGYVLSVKVFDFVHHYIIEQLKTSSNEFIYKSGEIWFKTLQELLEHFKEYPLEDNYRTTLVRSPHIRLHPVSFPPRDLLRTSILPVEAIVLTDYNPTAYESDALELKVDQRIWVTDMKASGRWEGVREDYTKKGNFPCAHVRLNTNRSSYIERLENHRTLDLMTFDE